MSSGWKWGDDVANAAQRSAIRPNYDGSDSTLLIEGFALSKRRYARVISCNCVQGHALHARLYESIDGQPREEMLERYKLELALEIQQPGGGRVGFCPICNAECLDWTLRDELADS